MVNAQWLFENHLSHLAMEKYLLTRIDHIIRPSSLENAGEILSQTLKHPVSDIPIQKNHQGSSTERIALLLQEKEKEQSKESIEELNQQLFLCRFLLELYDAVLVSLIPREAWLVEAIYHQGIPISSIVNEPDYPYGYTVGQHPEEIAHAAAGLQNIAGLKAHLLHRVINGADHDRAGVVRVQRGGTGGTVFVIGQQIFQMLILLGPFRVMFIKYLRQTAPADVYTVITGTIKN